MSDERCPVYSRPDRWGTVWRCFSKPGHESDHVEPPTRRIELGRAEPLEWPSDIEIVAKGMMNAYTRAQFVSLMAAQDFGDDS